jgi:hypothetical protein
METWIRSHLTENAMRIPICSAIVLGAVVIGWTMVSEIDAQGDKGKDTKSAVRTLKFAPKDATVSFKIGGQNKLTALADAEAVEKLVGKDAAKALVDAVDFTKEQIVLVSWTCSGPPDGVLMNEMKDGKIQFYVQGPIDAKVRGQRARIAGDFFAVPRDAKVAFDPKER